MGAWTKLLLMAVLGVRAIDAQADCDDRHGVWSAMHDSTEVRLEITSFIGWNPQIRLAAWKAGKVLWTVDGAITCSNGVFTCFLDLPMSDGTSIGADVEIIRHSENLSEYFVFAHLAQTAYQAQRIEGVTLAVKWADGERHMDPIFLPSIYKFATCKP